MRNVIKSIYDNHNIFVTLYKILSKITQMLVEPYVSMYDWRRKINFLWRKNSEIGNNNDLKYVLYTVTITQMIATWTSDVLGCGFEDTPHQL